MEIAAPLSPTDTEILSSEILLYQINIAHVAHQVRLVRLVYENMLNVVAAGLVAADIADTEALLSLIEFYALAYFAHRICSVRRFSGMQDENINAAIRNFQNIFPPFSEIPLLISSVGNSFGQIIAFDMTPPAQLYPTIDATVLDQFEHHLWHYMPGTDIKTSCHCRRC